MENNKEKWKDLTIKEKIGYTTGLVAFAVGWILTIANFIYPPIGEISDSTLWVLGQALIYCGSVLGITQYISTSFSNLKKELKVNSKEEENN